MNRRRVVITGIGPITPIGMTRDGFWSGLQQQQSAVRSVTRFDPSQFRSHNAAEVNDFVPSDHLDHKRAKRLDRFAQFSVVASQMALDDANLDLSKEDRERVGANMGTALGGVSYAEGQLALYLTQGLRAVDATLALAVFGGAASCNIAIELGAMGPNSTNAMSCASGTIAIGDAFRQVRDGYADVMIAGGAEAPLAPLCFGAFALIRAMSTRNEEPEKASRPFDKDRDGFVMGEGAAVMILEEYERAKSRGAKIYGEVVGYGITKDLRRDRRLWHDQRRTSHDRAATRRLAGGAVDAARVAGCQHLSWRSRLRQHSRELDSFERQHRNDGDQAGAGRSRVSHPDEWNERLLRARPRSVGRDRSRDLCAGHGSRVATADRQPSGCGQGL